MAASYRRRPRGDGYTRQLMITFYWDFFGSDAEGTARHFCSHLEEFLQRETLEGCTVSLDNPAARHWVARCRAPVAVADMLRRALRPRREAAEA